MQDLTLNPMRKKTMESTLARKTLNMTHTTMRSRSACQKWVLGVVASGTPVMEKGTEVGVLSLTKENTEEEDS